MALKWAANSGRLHQYIAGISACLAVTTSGSLYGWMTPLLDSFLSPDGTIPMSKTASSWVVSVIEVGNIISPLPAGYLANKVGRKPLILASGPLYILTWLLVLWLRSAVVLAVIRVLQGMTMGFVFTVTPVYLGEIASDSMRGAITSIFFSSWWVGYILSVAVGPILDFTSFTWFTLALNVPFILMFLWQPESPYYSLMVGNSRKAQESLRWLRDSSDELLAEELTAMEKSVESDMRKSGGIRDLIRSAADRKCFALLIIISAVRISSGSGTLLTYATRVFSLTPNLVIPADTVTFAFGIVMFVGGLLGAFTSDTFGRRSLLLVSCFGCFCCNFLTGTYYCLLVNSSSSVSSVIVNFSWVSPLLILLYAGLCSSGLYPVCISYTSELFPSHTRSLAASFGSCSVTLFAFIVLSIFQPIYDWVGVYGNFYLYALATFLGFVYFYFTAPETKGKSFVQIRKELLGKNGSEVKTEDDFS